MDLENRIKLFESNQVKPTRTTLIKNFDGSDAWKLIQSGYESESILNNMVASLFNAVLTENLPCFMMSKNIMETIIRRDKNLDRKTLNSTEYKTFIKYLTESPPICKCVVSPSTFGIGKKVAGLYRIVDLDTRGYFRDIETREQRIVQLYCDYQKIDKIILDKIETI